MSISMPDSIAPESAVTADEVKELATKYGLSIPEDELQDYAALLAGVNHYAKEVMALPDCYPKLNYDLYPRAGIHKPEGVAQDKEAWAWKATVKSTKLKNDLLKDITVALKDNIALAGVPCTNGTVAVGWVPHVDATVVTRILDAGGFYSRQSSIDTSVTGPVHNPYADGYNCGGSSSGNGKLVGAGLVDVAVGCDQGGSIRIPSANCGVVGLKPTWGLVPYTGIISLEATLGHAGPMAKNVLGCARLLEVIAGTGGIDDRQSYNHAPGTIKYTDEIAKQLAFEDQSLKGIKVGVLEKGFQDPMTDPNVAKASRSAIEGFRALGAEVKSVHIPLHKESGMLWMVVLPMSSIQEGLLGAPTG